MSKKPSTAARMHNSGNKLFLAACEISGVSATHRQFRKWERGFGSAFAAKAKAQASLAGK